MVDKIDFVTIAEFEPTLDLATSALATTTSIETPNPSLSHSMTMSRAGELLMTLVEMVLPDTAMKMVNEWMHSTNGAFRGMASYLIVTPFY